MTIDEAGGDEGGGEGRTPGDVTVAGERRQRVRTFKPRRRALSPARQQRFERLSPTWLIGDETVARGWSEIFGRESVVVLDVGIGDGQSCVDLAGDHPDLDVIGVDVHTPGIAHAVFSADERHLDNLRLHHGDVFELLDRVAPSSLAGIRVLFPDPWPKVRHRNRRLVTPERVDVLVSKLAVGGFFHLATDIADYADQTATVCGACPNLSGGFVERSARPVTRFEQRGLDAGRSISELVYERVGDGCSPASPSPSPTSSSLWASRFSRATESMNSETMS